MMKFSLCRYVAYPMALLTILAGWWFLDPNGELLGADADGRAIMTLDDDSDTARALAFKQSELRDRIDYKERLLTGYLRGDYTLRELAREFARVNAYDETTLHMMRCAYPGESDEEKAANNVYDYLKGRQLPENEQNLLLERARTEIDCLFPH